MLTNTERQQIVEEVNAGTYGMDEALDDIAAAQKGEEVRKALYAEALVLNREGHAGSTDMIARQQIANLQTSVNGQISTLRTEVGEDIDDLETALNSGLATQNGRIAAQNATIANVVANYNVEYGSTELWASTGETGALAAGTTVTLSEDVSHFDYIDIYSFCGNSNVLDTVPVDAKLQSSQGYALRWVNLSDPGSGTYEAYVRIIETKIKIIGTTLTIIHQVTYSNGASVTISGAEITQSNRSTYMGELGIMKVVGRKITANTEIEDVRIGADGTEYDSAGAAVRGQIGDLRTDLLSEKTVRKTADSNLQSNISAEETRAKAEEKRIEELFTTPTQEAVENWLNDHPEATTTVQDEAVTRNKLAQHITDYLPLDYIQTKFEKDGGETTVWYAIIPSDYKPKLRLANDTIHTVETATDNANRHHSTITINSGIFYTADGKTKGYLIKDGEVLNNVNYDDGTNLDYVYMDSNGILNSIGPSTNVNVSDLERLNPEWAFLGFYALVKNGVYVATGRADDYYNAPRTFIGQDTNGNYIVGVSSGRNEGEKGLSMIDIYNFCLNVANFTPHFLYNLDGGGSSAFIYKGTRVSTLTQGENRKCANYLSFEKENTRLTNTFEAINVIDNELIEIEQYLYNNVELAAKIPKRIKGISTSGFTDCNDITETSIYLCGDLTANFPINNYGFLITLRTDGKQANQIALNKDHLFIRQLWVDTTITPSEWKEVYSPPSHEYATSGTNVSANTVRYIKSGNVVVVKADAYISATISANSILATSLPEGFMTEQNGVIFKSGNVYRVKVTGEGELVSLDELPSGYYKLSLTYICK